MSEHLLNSIKSGKLILQGREIEKKEIYIEKEGDIERLSEGERDCVCVC